MVELLPALLSPENFVEVFHSLVDLPLTTCAMEKTEEFGSFSFLPSHGSTYMMVQEQKRLHLKEHYVIIY